MRFPVALIRALLVLPLLAVPSPLFAADYADKAQLDELFAELRIAHSPDEATDIVAQIWTAWFNPDVPDLADRMNRMGLAMHTGDFTTALTDLAGFYRDVLVLQLSAGVEVATADREAEMREQAANSSPESTLRRLDAILGCRELLDANANPLLALESLMLRLRAG